MKWGNTSDQSIPEEKLYAPKVYAHSELVLNSLFVKVLFRAPDKLINIWEKSGSGNDIHRAERKG